MNSRLMGALAGIFSCCCCGQNPSSLSDTEATSVIEKQWLDDDVLAIFLGPMTVIGGLGSAPDRKLNSHELNRAGFQSMQVFEQLGVISLKQVEDVTKHFTWENWMATTQQGVQMRLTVSSGPRTSEFPCNATQQVNIKKRFGDGNWICVTTGQSKVDRIVQNEARTIGVDKYRAVLGTYTVTLSQIMTDFYSRTGHAPGPERKFMAALKFDAFASEWQVAAQDLALRKSEFTTANVNKIFIQQ